MAPADHWPASPRRDNETPPAARTDQMATAAARWTNGDGGNGGEQVLRRRHPELPGPTSSVPEPGVMEEARPLGCVSRYDVIKGRMYRLLYVALGVTMVFLLSGIASTSLDWYRGLGVALTYTGAALAVACWAGFLCTCAERSRTFLVAVVPGFLLDPLPPEVPD
ncbi:hypothetical protein HPB50_016423 [Hyalomma asiaticum]|uniref:Uncharacterized protein n=1 Tax=Hyalomma asiaticum TaxID=266040 RepID=A0ACB7SX44_HYAAI|nr:hypothetical protein HPB50_016423 [Hyalomma asiaticum]